MSPLLLRCRLVGLCTIFAWLLAGPLAAQCNTAPTAVADASSTVDNQTLLIDVLANDSDADGDRLTVLVQSWTCPGEVTVGSFGVVTYEPASVSDLLPCEIRYQAGDGTASSEAVVTVEVIPFQPEIFSDGFESGDTSAWDETQG